MRFNIDTFRKRKEAAFAWLNATQFFGAMNDNVFKALIQMFIVGLVIKTESAAGGAKPVAIATILFALPYLFLSSYGGFLADRFSKKQITVILKYAELGTMLLALPAFGFGLNWMLYLLLFIMSAQSALFSPTKYSILPEIVKPDKLSRANSALVACSFIAIIIGSATAPLLAEGMSKLFKVVPGVGGGTAYNLAYLIAQLVCVLLAVAGILSSHRVVPLKSVKPGLHPDWLFPRKMWMTWTWVKKDRPLALAMTGSWIFSMVAAFLQINLVIYGIWHLGLNEKQSSFLFFFAALGISLGAFASGRLSKRNIEFGTMPGGAFTLAISTYILGLLPAGPHPVAVPIIVLVAGLGAGMFVVPLDTFLQIRLPASKRGEGLALNSFLSWFGILTSGVLLYVFDVVGFRPSTGFLIMAFPAMIVAMVCFFSLKDFAFRFFVTCAVKLLYRVRTIGAENVPVAGPAILLANHASYMDSVLLCATSRRRIRFLMSSTIYRKNRILRKIYDLYGVIPVDAKSSPREIASAFRAARQALDDGYMVCVFPEGGITRTGTIRAFKRGYERIVRGTNYPLIPVYMGGSWGTIYHYYQGQLVRRWFRMSLCRYPVTVVFGRRMPSTTDAFHVRQAVMELSCDYFNTRRTDHSSLAKTMISRLRHAWSENLASDSMGISVTSGKALIASIAVARAISPRVEKDEHVGILLPACSAGLIANIATTLLGRASVNLNFTTSPSSFTHSVELCKLSTIITSGAFIGALKEKNPALVIPREKLVFIEDILKAFRSGSIISKLHLALLAKFASLKAMVPATMPTTPDSQTIVLFSSGSTGEPKGVMLSNHNVLSMIESLQMMLATVPTDRICGALPLFHSFGIMGTVWYPILAHIKVSYHPNPLDAETVVKIVREDKCTFLFGTPTFLSIYHRKATREDFKTLRFILAGAEKLKETLAKAYQEKFGIRPYEGYGATELSPGIAVNVPHGTGGGITQEGWREGRVGHPCPGVAMKIFDPETGREMGPGESGLLYLKGPNVMLGYLGRPDLTEAAVKDGWYCTGDIALIDEDGFVGLTDRLSRFSKIGGEMVPHVAVEEAFLNAKNLTISALAVGGVSDEKKGEKLVVLYTAEAGDPMELADALDAANIPNLWKPSRKDYYLVEAIPILGTGKADLAGIKKLAKEKAGVEQS